MTPVSPETLQRLLAEHRGALVLYARQWCAVPEDVVQEAFLQLVRQREEPRNAVGWLYRVVRNRAISAARSAGRRTRHEAAAAGRGEPWFVGSSFRARRMASDFATKLQLSRLAFRKLVLLAAAC